MNEEPRWNEAELEVWRANCEGRDAGDMIAKERESERDREFGERTVRRGGGRGPRTACARTQGRERERER